MKSLKYSGHSKVIFLLIGAGLALAFCLTLVLAQRIRDASRQVRPRRISPNSREIVLGADGNLQEAIKLAKFGDTIILEAGATYPGPVILPNKGPGSGTDADYITIRTSNLPEIAKDGERIKPAVHSRFMPKIVSSSQSVAVGTEPQAHHYRFVGVEFAPSASANYVFNLIDLGASDYSSYSSFPHHLVFDRCYVHSTGLNKARRGFALNSGEASIINSHISGFAGAGDETQAISSWNGPGPFHIINNFLEAGSELILIGGSDPSIPNLVPSDIEIRRNHFHRPSEWSGKAGIKGTFELKNARRVVVDGNLLESEILTTAFVITTRNQNGKAPWSVIEDVQITNNIVRHASSGFNIMGSDNVHPSEEAKRIRIANNLLLDLVPDDPHNSAFFLQLNGVDFLTIEHNTVQQTGNIIVSFNRPTRNFVFRDNIVQFNLYGFVCGLTGVTCPPENPFCNCFPGGIMARNVVADNLNAVANEPKDRICPPGNFLVRSYDQVGFVNYVMGSWGLAGTSKYRGRATSGKDPGVDFSAIEASGANRATDGTALPLPN